MKFLTPILLFALCSPSAVFAAETLRGNPRGFVESDSPLPYLGETKFQFDCEVSALLNNGAKGIRQNFTLTNESESSLRLDPRSAAVLEYPPATDGKAATLTARESSLLTGHGFSVDFYGDEMTAHAVLNLVKGKTAFQVNGYTKALVSDGHFEVHAQYLELDPKTGERKDSLNLTVNCEKRFHRF